MNSRTETLNQLFQIKKVIEELIVESDFNIMIVRVNELQKSLDKVHNEMLIYMIWKDLSFGNDTYKEQYRMNKLLQRFL